MKSMNIHGPGTSMLSVAAAFLALLPALASPLLLEGSLSSYAQFRKWQATPNASLEFDFQTTQPSGVLLYTDDGGYYDFVELKLVEGSVQLRFNFGAGAEVLTVGRGLNDGRWHRVSLLRAGAATTLAVDDARDAVLPRPPPHLTMAGGGGHQQRARGTPTPDLALGTNLTSNSFVYVGGLPSWYSTKLSSLALPSVVFEPRFRGAVRNLVYADATSRNGRPKRQEISKAAAIDGYIELFRAAIGRRLPDHEEMAMPLRFVIGPELPPNIQSVFC